MGELLIVQDCGDSLRVIGVQPKSKSVVDSGKTLIIASDMASRIINEALTKGLEVYIPKTITTKEVMPSDIVIKESSDALTAAKNLAMRDIMNLMHQNIFGMSVIDCMDYLDCMMKLMSAGIFITDENREDKYFEIIEAAQTTEEPTPLGDKSTFEEEQAYIEQKNRYDRAQANLSTLEKYLNAYDRLSKVRFVGNMLDRAKENVEKAKTLEELTEVTKEYCENVREHFFNMPCST